MDIYNKYLLLLKEYFNKAGWENYFLFGGCYWFANLIHEKLPDSYLVINRVEEHCAICIDGKIYDVRGQIPNYNFHKATKREISFMKKNYKPQFDVSNLEVFLEKNV